MSALQSDPTYAKTLLEQAKSRGGKSCENAMKVLLVFNSTYAPAAWELGQIYRSRGEHVQASMWFQRAVNSDAALAEELFALGRQHEQQGEMEQCRSVYELVLAAAPWHVECAWRFAHVKEDLLGDAESADVLFERALQRGLENRDTPFLVMNSSTENLLHTSTSTEGSLYSYGESEQRSLDERQHSAASVILPRLCIPGKSCISGCVYAGGRNCMRNRHGVCESWKTGFLELIQRGCKREAAGDPRGAVRLFGIVLKYGKFDKQVEGEALFRCAHTLHMVMRDYDQAEECEQHLSLVLIMHVRRAHDECLAFEIRS
jgi:tetratricopeptide (TPR) repeat protein